MMCQYILWKMDYHKADDPHLVVDRPPATIEIVAQYVA